MAELLQSRDRSWWDQVADRLLKIALRLAASNDDPSPGTPLIPGRRLRGEGGWSAVSLDHDLSHRSRLLEPGRDVSLNALPRQDAMSYLAVAALLTLPGLTQAEDVNANKRLVLDFFRIVFEAHNVEAAKNYLSEDYVQHNPLVATGLDGFMNYFRAKWTAPKPVNAELGNPPARIVSEGDLVTVMWKIKKTEPKDKSKSYDAFWFDMFRVKDGKLVEHWDNATKN